MPYDCPICGERAEPSFRKGVHRYRKCVSCGTLFVAGDFRPEDIHSRYSRDYFEASGANEFKERRGYPSYMEAQQSLISSFSRKLDLIRDLLPNGKLLDVGAAYGTFLSLATPYYECFGLDVSEYAAQVACSQFGLSVRQGSIEESTPFADECFDVVVMWDVIEHLIDPVRGLKEVRRILKPGGWLTISTDDVANWLPRFLGRHWWALAPPLHLCHFTRQGMTTALNRAGGFGQVQFMSDTREYRIGEIVGHFGVSFRNRGLTDMGKRLDKTSIGQRAITVTRPEQFIAIARKKERMFA